MFFFNSRPCPYSCGTFLTLSSLLQAGCLWMDVDFDHHHNFELQSNSIKDSVAAKCIWSTHMSSVSGLWAAAARLASFPAPFPAALYCGEQQSVCCLPAWAPSMCPTHFNRTQYIMNTYALNIYICCISFVVDEEYRCLVGNCISYNSFYIIYYIIHYVSHCIAVIVDDDHWCAVDEYPASCGRLTVWWDQYQYTYCSSIFSISIYIFSIFNRHTFLHIHTHTTFVHKYIFSYSYQYTLKINKIKKKTFLTPTN